MQYHHELFEEIFNGNIPNSLQIFDTIPKDQQESILKYLATFNFIFPDPLLALAELFIKIGKTDEAIQQYDRAIARDKNCENALIARERLRLQKVYGKSAKVVFAAVEKAKKTILWAQQLRHKDSPEMIQLKYACCLLGNDIARAMAHKAILESQKLDNPDSPDSDITNLLTKINETPLATTPAVIRVATTMVSPTYCVAELGVRPK